MPEDYIPASECEDRRVYEIRGRNFFLGAYRASSRGFIGIREKLGNRYLSEEYHRDASTHHGTATPLVALDVVVPPEVPLMTRLPVICGVCQQQRPEAVQLRLSEVRDANWRLVTDLSGWDHAPGIIHDNHKVEPVFRANDALFTWLEPLAAGEEERWWQSEGSATYRSISRGTGLNPVSTREQRLSESMVFMLEAVLTDRYPVGNENTLRALLKRRFVVFVASDPTLNTTNKQLWGLTPEGERALSGSPLVSSETRRQLSEYRDSDLYPAVAQAVQKNDMKDSVWRLK